MTTKLVEQRQEKILRYLESQRKDVLTFKRSRIEREDGRLRISYDPVEMNTPDDVDELIFQLMKLSINCVSINEAGETETGAGRLRSSLDLWRHARLYHPKISIFEVMNSIRRLWESGRIYGHYCSVVRRSVFEPISWEGQYKGNSRFRCREYGNISFSSWLKLT